MPSYEDLVQDPAASGDAYFDGEEFALRSEIEATQYWHVHRRHVLLSTLRGLDLAPDARLVELGCGIESLQPDPSTSSGFRSYRACGIFGKGSAP